MAACSDYAAKLCARAQACEPGVLPLFGYATNADCVSAQADSCQLALTEPHTGYTPTLAQACGDELAAMTCEAFRSQTTAPACLAGAGTIALGGSCDSGSQCASRRCNIADFTRCGTCVAQVPLGQPCMAFECADNLVCSLPAVGAASPVCTKPVGIGGACIDSSVCPVDAFCAQTTHTCTKLPALGDACDPSIVVFCDPSTTSAVCDPATSRCVGPIVVVQPGGGCSGSLATACAGGTCNFDVDAGTGTCVGNVPNGGSCAPTDQCVSGSSCVGGICQPLVCDGTPGDAGATAFVAVGRFTRPRSPLALRPGGWLTGASGARPDPGAR